MHKLYIVTKVILPKRKILFSEQKEDLQTILKHVETFTKISIARMKSKERTRIVTDARSIFFAFCYNYSKSSLSEIADMIFKNHSTVIYGNKKTEIVLKNEYALFLNYMQNNAYKLIKVNRQLHINNFK